MVDVGSKSSTQRTATASGRILIPKVAYDLVVSGGSPTATDGDSEGLPKAKEKARKKGDILAVSQIAGIMACKRTAELIPLCHSLSITHIDVLLTPEVKGDGVGTDYSVRCEAEIPCTGKTGVEMEALTAVSVALLNVWDMLKAVGGKDMEIQGIVVKKKVWWKERGLFQATCMNSSILQYGKHSVLNPSSKPGSHPSKLPQTPRYPSHCSVTTHQMVPCCAGGLGHCSRQRDGQLSR